MIRILLRCFLFLSLVVVIVCLTLDRSMITRYIEQETISLGRRANLQIALNNPDVTLQEISADFADIFVPRLFMAFRISQISVRPVWASLLMLRPEIAFDATAYTGSVRFTGSKPLSADNVSGSLEIDRAAIREHPQLSILGITAGTVSIDIPHFEVVNRELESLDGTFRIEGLEKPQPTTISLASFGLPGGGVIPALTGCNVSARLTVRTTDRLRESIFELADLRSSLISGKGSIRLAPSPAGMSPALSGSIDFDLTDEGAKEIGPYVAARFRTQPSAKHLTLVFKGSARSPDMVITERGAANVPPQAPPAPAETPAA